MSIDRLKAEVLEDFVNKRDKILSPPHTIILAEGIKFTDFYGIWGDYRGEIPTRGIFTLFLDLIPNFSEYSDLKDKKINGMILDGLGDAIIKDLKITKNNINFTKIYSDEAKNNGAAINPIDYRGKRIGKMYAGEYSFFHKESEGNIKGPFFLAKYLSPFEYSGLYEVITKNPLDKPENWLNSDIILKKYKKK